MLFKKHFIHLQFLLFLLVYECKAQLQIDSAFGQNAWAKIKYDTYNAPIDLIADSGDTLYVLNNTSFIDSTLFNTDIIITKIKPDGEVDLLFGNNGTMRFDINGYDVSNGKELLMLNDSEIVLLASAYNSKATSYSPFIIIKIKSSGEFDTTFSHNGICKIEFMKLGEMPSSIEKDIHGNILVAGSTKDTIDALDEIPVVARITSIGNLDTTFGDKGKLYIQYQFGAIQKMKESLHLVGGFIKDLVVLPDEKIMLGGGYADGYKIKSFIVRIDQNGKVDSSFNNYGYVSFNIDQYINNTVNKMVLYNDTLYFGIETSNEAYGDFYVGKLNIYTSEFELNIDEVSSQEDEIKDIIISNTAEVISTGWIKNTINKTPGYLSDYFAISQIIKWENNFIYAHHLSLQLDSMVQNGGIALVQQKNGRIVILGLTGTALDGFDVCLLALNDKTFSSVDNLNKDQDKMTIFPNPASDFICIKNLNLVKNVSIFNSLGEFIKEYNYCRFNNDMCIDISKFSVGMYFINVGGCSKIFICE
jgi:uncharacterized delta-60 repeat protein